MTARQFAFTSLFSNAPFSFPSSFFFSPSPLFLSRRQQNDRTRRSPCFARFAATPGGSGGPEIDQEHGEIREDEDAAAAPAGGRRATKKGRSDQGSSCCCSGGGGGGRDGGVLLSPSPAPRVLLLGFFFSARKRRRALLDRCSAFGRKEPSL